MQIPSQPHVVPGKGEPQAYRRPFIVNLTFVVCGAAVFLLILNDFTH